METTFETAYKASTEITLKLGYQDVDYLAFAELRGSKDDIIETLVAGLLVFAVGALIFTLLKG